MDVFEAIARRHSYRESFRDEPVPRADLRRIVQAGLQAPSGKNAQTSKRPRQPFLTGRLSWRAC